jgi:hypothetical protein
MSHRKRSILTDKILKCKQNFGKLSTFFWTGKILFQLAQETILYVVEAPKIVVHYLEQKCGREKWTNFIEIRNNIFNKMKTIYVS